jgi:hypothetical protein
VGPEAAQRKSCCCSKICHAVKEKASVLLDKLENVVSKGGQIFAVGVYRKVQVLFRVCASRKRGGDGYAVNVGAEA